MNVSDPQRRRQKLLATGDLISCFPPYEFVASQCYPHILDYRPHVLTAPEVVIFKQRIYNRKDCVIAWENKALVSEFQKLNKFTALLRQGVSTKTACNRLHTSMSKLLNPKSKKAKEKVLEILSEFSMEAETRAKLARAITNKAALAAVESDDWKLALQAAKQISEDPETGMQPNHVTSLTQVNIDPGFLRALNNVEIPKELDDIPEGKLLEAENIDER